MRGYMDAEYHSCVLESIRLPAADYLFAGNRILKARRGAGSYGFENITVF